VASWLPILRGLTPHGMRHGLQAWMDEDGIPEVLKTERMGHEMPGMHGVYGHVSPAMHAILKAALRARWEDSLRERAQAVTALDCAHARCSPGRLPTGPGQDPLLTPSQNQTWEEREAGPRPYLRPLTW
jgi:hypothetical protein